MTGERAPHSARPAGNRAADRRRRLDAVLDAAARAASLVDLLQVTLAALDEHLGYARSAFMLAVAEPPLSGRRAYAGVTHGSPEYMLEEYFERWADRDPLASDPAAGSFLGYGRTRIADIYELLDRPRRLFVDDFLRRTHAQHELSHRLPVAWTDAYLTLMGPDEHTLDDERLLAQLVPDLRELLRRHLPRGLDAGLSVREAQTAELLTLGMTNREIAGVLHVEEDTVKKHVSRALGKVGVDARTSLAVAWATGRRMDLGGALL